MPIVKRLVAGVGRRIRARLARAVAGGRFVHYWAIILLRGLYDHLWLALVFRKHDRRHRLAPRVAPGAKRRRIVFVIPWYGKDIGGGAEAEARGLVHALRRNEPDLHVEVWTTTLKEFAADWNVRFHTSGERDEDGVTVRRFHATTPDREVFNFLNGRYLMQGAGPCPRDPRQSPLPRLAEAYFIRRMIHSPALLDCIGRQLDTVDAFVFIPYMFGLTVEGCMLAGPKAMLIPCLHDERYAYLHIYRKAFSRIGAALCHVRSEAALFARLYPDAPRPALIGEQVDVAAEPGDEGRFRAKYGISEPFILYAGRQVAGKNVPLLVDYFRRFRETHAEWSDLQLVLIGKGDLDYSGVPGVRALGFVPPADKLDAYRAALCLGMLSVNESFSIVLMESWLQETPAIVAADCAVTADHVRDSGGGYAASSAGEFASALCDLLKDEGHRRAMGRKGRAYVVENFTPERVTRRFREELERGGADRPSQA